MKNKFRTLKFGFLKGIIAIVFSQVIIKIFGFIYKIFLVNKEGFGDAGNAIYNSAFQIYAILLTFSSIGVPNAIAKIVSARLAICDYKGAYKVFKVAFVLFAFLGSVGALILFFGAKYISINLLEMPEAEHSLIALAPSIFFVSISSVIKGFFNGQQNIKAMAYSQIIEQICKTIFTIIFVIAVGYISKNNTILMSASANLATTFSSFVCLGYLCLFYSVKKEEFFKKMKQQKYKKYINIWRILKKILIVSVPIALSALIGVAIKSIDALTIVQELRKNISIENAKELYGILSGKIDTLIVLPLSFNAAISTVLIPNLSYNIEMNNSTKVIKSIKLGILITLIFSIPCSLGLLFFAEPIMMLVFPNASEGSLLLKVSSISIIFMSLVQTINGVLQAMGKGHISICSLGIGIIIKYILNIVLISNIKIGIYGAAIASFISYFVVFILSSVCLNKYIKNNFK